MLKILPLVLLLCACEDFYYNIYWQPEVDIEFSSLDDAWRWVSLNISYEDDPDNIWQSPRSTYIRRKGDCEDKALLLGCFAYRLGYYSEILVIETDTALHAILAIDGVYYEPAIYRKYYSTKYVTQRQRNSFTYFNGIGKSMRSW